MRQVGRYDIVRRTGQTPLGTIYEAVDRETRRTVSLQAAEERCSESLGRLQHPNIRSLIAVEHADGQIFLVLEHLDARPLNEFVAARKSGPTEITRLLKAAAQGLDYAHANGVTHPGLTPRHLLVNQDGVLKVAGFELPGIDTIEGSATEAERGEVEASVPYQAAEFLAGEQDISRASQFSLGVIAFELLTGRRPLEGVSPFGVMAASLRGSPADLSAVESKFDTGTRRVLERMLARDPEMRYANNCLGIEALEAMLRLEPAAPTRVAEVPAPISVIPPVAERIHAEKDRTRNQLRWIIAATVITALAMAILIASQVLSNKKAASPNHLPPASQTPGASSPQSVSPPPQSPAIAPAPETRPAAPTSAPKPLKRRKHTDTTPTLRPPVIE